jgi:hypothetical protein
MLAVVERLRDALVAVGHDAPNEQHEQADDERNREGLRRKSG